MKILVSGSGGMVGSALLPVLRAAGHQVTRLVRRPSAPLGPEDSTVQWNPETGELDGSRLEGIEAVVHLAGENIAARRWTPAQKARIRDSRVQGTARLSERLANLTQPPATLVAASAIGYYGDRGEELLNEDSSSGDDFLSEVCRQWEAALPPPRQKKASGSSICGSASSCLPGAAPWPRCCRPSSWAPAARSATVNST